MNEWTQQEERWLDMTAWDQCGGELPASLDGLECAGGLDLSSTTDLTAFALAFRLPDDRVALLCEAWIPRDKMREREQRDRVPYGVWERTGIIHATPGNVVDYEHVEARIVELAKRYNPKIIAFDPWSAAHLCQRLQDYHGLPMGEHRQGYGSMSGPSKEFERLVLQGGLAHGGNPILRWNADSVSISSDPAGNIKPVKPERDRSGKRIDCIVASIMAVGCLLNAKGKPRSVYADRGLLVI